MGERRQLSGTYKRKGDLWWALCKEYPVAGHGKTQDEALSSVLEMVRLYESASGEVAREDNDFRLELAAVG